MPEAMLSAAISRLLDEYSAHEIVDALIEVGGAEVVPSIEASVQGFYDAADQPQED